MAKRVWLLVLCLLAACSVAPALADVTHAFAWRPGVGAVDLGVLPGYTSSCARAVSDSGTVVGYAYAGDGSLRAFSWTQSGGMVDLGALPGAQRSSAYGINNLGQIVGFSANAQGESRAVLWDTDGSIVDLGTLMPDGSGNSVAFGINANGMIVGTADVPLGYETIGSNAFSWTSSTGMADLGRAHPDDAGSSARAVNNAGVIAGRSSANADWSSAYVVTSQGWSEIGSGIALGINDAGTVVGNDGLGRGFRWDSLTGTAGLVALPGYASSQATAINADGHIVGASSDADGHTNATIWYADGATTDLGALLGDSYRSMAYGMNSQGEVVGAVAVPGVPGIISLSVGLGLLALRRFRR